MTLLHTGGVVIVVAEVGVMVMRVPKIWFKVVVPKVGVLVVRKEIC